MSNYAEDRSEWLSIHLSGNAKPEEFISKFFNEFDMITCKNRLWFLLKGILTSELSNEWNEIQRSDFIFFYEELQTLVEADYLLFRNRLEREKIEYLNTYSDQQ